MNVIYGKHDGCSKEFVWEVPGEMKDYILKGDLLLVDTARGIDVVTATTGVISGDGARDVAEKNGAYFPLKRVISFVDSNLKVVLIEKYKRAMIEHVAGFNYDEEPALPY